MSRLFSFFVEAIKSFFGTFIPGLRTTAKQRYNVQKGLPKDWEPQQYLGPPKDAPPSTTPAGIVVFTRGYDNKKIPSQKHGLKARVQLETVDNVWNTVIQEMLDKNWSRLGSGLVKGLTESDREKVRGVAKSGVLPTVYIEPSIWWDASNVNYVAGLTNPRPPFNVHVVVWYRSILDSSIKNWETLLHWEFTNHVLLRIGRPDLAY